MSRPREAARAGLYAGHGVKQELVVGPEVLQPPDYAFKPKVALKGLEGTESAVKKEPTITIQEPITVKIEPVTELELAAVKQESSQWGDEVLSDKAHSDGSLGKILKIKSCPIKLETSLDDNKVRTTTTCDETLQLSPSSMTNTKIAKTYICMCAICKEQFLQTADLKQHLRSHAREKPYICETCQKQFSNEYGMKRHKRTHTGEKPYACDICGKQFTQASNLGPHKRIHTGEKLYSCDICHKQFSDASALAGHKQTHTEDKPFACETCNKQFKRASHLKIHKQSHTGDKPYSCEICKKQFTSLSVVRRHQRIHTGDKPHSCGSCGKQFARATNLKRHRLIHDAE